MLPPSHPLPYIPHHIVKPQLVGHVCLDGTGSSPSIQCLILPWEFSLPQIGILGCHLYRIIITPQIQHMILWSIMTLMRRSLPLPFTRNTLSDPLTILGCIAMGYMHHRMILTEFVQYAPSTATQCSASGLTSTSPSCFDLGRNDFLSPGSTRRHFDQFFMR